MAASNTEHFVFSNAAGAVSALKTGFAQDAVALGLLRVPEPEGARFPGRKGAPGMPWIADVRGALSDPILRRRIVMELARRFRREFQSAEMIIGLSKAGIAWGALLAWKLDLPGGVVHLDGPRSSGLQRDVEGPVGGRRVLLIDNLTRSHTSLIEAAQIIEANDGIVAGAMPIVGRTTGPAPFPISPLCGEGDLEREGLRQGVLTEAHLVGNPVDVTGLPTGKPSFDLS